MANLSTKIEDNICPICLCIFIQPVTMPCEHELCLSCFKQNVEEANFCCPMCRTRISTWARRAARNKTLVNEMRWKFIQDTFPDQIKSRIDGNEEDEEMRALNVSIRLAEPGEIRSEYEQQLKQLQDQRLEEKMKELEASERLISVLQAEEKRKMEELDLIAKRDEELARKLSEVDPNSPLEQRLRSCRSTDSEETHGATSERSRSNCESMETFINKMRSENNMSKSPYPYRCLTPVGTGNGKLCVDKDKVLHMEEQFRQQKIKRDKNLITTQDIAHLEEQFKSQRARAISDVEIIDIDRLSRGSESNMSMGMTHVVSNSSLNQNEILDQMSAGLNVNVNFTDTRPASDDIIVLSPSPELVEDVRTLSKSSGSHKTSTTASTSSCSYKSAQDVQDRSVSAQSTDSISQELTHFRPIRSCPLTPPRKLPSGKVVEPQLIRTTPRNLHKSGFGSPLEANLSDIDAGSPIMQRRLSELAEERKDKVLRMSKCTSTIKDEENRNPQQEDSSSGSQVTRRNTCRSVDFKDISNSPINTKRKFDNDVVENSSAKQKLIIPLVPDLEDVFIHETDIPVTKPVAANKSKDRLSKSKRGNSRKVRYVSGDATNKDGINSPQASIMKWMIRDDDLKTCRKNVNGDYFMDSNRDEVDGDKKSENMKKGNLKCENNEKGNQHLAMAGCSQQNVKLSPRIQKFLSQNEPMLRHTRTRTNRKKLYIDDYVYDNNQVRKKPSVTHEANDSSCDGFYSDGDSESSEESLSPGPVRKKQKINASVKDPVIKSNKLSKEPKLKPKSLLKTTKYVKKSSRGTVSGTVKSNANAKNVKSLKTMHDFFSLNNASITDSAQELDNDKCHMTQEEKDRKMAEELQKQFEMEAKHHLNSLRFKGSTDEYSFRSRPKNLSV